MDDDLAHQLDGLKTNDFEEIKKPSKKRLIIIIIVVIVVVLVGVGLLLYFLVFKKKKNNEETLIKRDVPTDVNGKIPNSFKFGGVNFNETIGNLNGGEDFDKNDRNNFDYCIPAQVKQRKNKHNMVYLQLHGGGWAVGEKENISLFCNTNSEFNAITVVMSYTLLNGTYNQSSVFRILDDITATINKVKEELKSEGFDINKLELAMHGSSAGAHLVSLYSFLVKNHPLPIKLISNQVGPLSVSPYDNLIAKDEVGSLASIEPESIELAKRYKTIKYLNGGGEYHMTQYKLIFFMNSFFGNKFNDSINEMYDWEKQEIKYNNPKFIGLLNKTEYVFPHKYVNKDSPPMICSYGGKDIGVGIGQYAVIKKAYNDAGISNKIELIYARYGNHDLGGYTPYGEEIMAKYRKKKLEMMKIYFKSMKE